MTPSAITPEAAELYRAAIGDRHQAYYLHQFDRFEASGRVRASWHWPAFFVTLNWLVYRCLWGPALGFAALSMLLFAAYGLGRTLWSVPHELDWLAALLLLSVLFVLPAMYANALYHAWCKRRIHNTLAASNTVQEACTLLAAQSSSRRCLLVLPITVTAVLLLALGLGSLLFNWWTVSSLQEARTTSAQGAVDTPAATSAMSSSTPNLSSTPPAVTLAAEPTPATAQSATASAPTSSEVAVTAMGAASASVTASKQGSANSASPQPPVMQAAAVMPGQSGQWVVQVGAYAKPANVKKVQDQLKAAGIACYTEPVDGANGPQTRVRVGPFQAKAQANAMVEKITKLSLPALLTRLPR